MAFGVITSSTNPGPNVVISAQENVLPSSGYQADSPGTAGVNAGSTLILDDTYNAVMIALNALTGSVVTLPPATGSGKAFPFVVTAAPTSNSHKVQVAASTDFIIGTVLLNDSATVTGYVAANSATVSTNSDTITLNGTTTGGLKVGDSLLLTDFALNTWLVSTAVLNASGTAATPFSAAV